MNRSKSFSSKPRISFAVLAAVASVSTTFAATKTWDGGGGNSNWATGNNWNSNVVPTTTDDILLDGSFPVTTTTDGLTATVRSVELNLAGNFTLGNSGNGNGAISALTITGKGDSGNTLIRLTNTATGTFLIKPQSSGNRNLTLNFTPTGGVGTFDVVNASGVLHLQAAQTTSSAANYTKTGAGTLKLETTNGPATFGLLEGGFNINAGTLIVANQNALYNTGDATSKGTITVANNAVLQMGNAGSISWASNAPSITLNSGSTLRASGGTNTYGKASGLKVAGGATVSMGTVASGDVLALNTGIDTSGAGTRTINITGAGTVLLTTTASNDTGSYNFDVTGGGELVTSSSGANPFGAVANSVKATSGAIAIRSTGALNTSLAGYTYTLAGGTFGLDGTANTTFTNAQNVSITATNSTIAVDRSSNGAGVSYNLGGGSLTTNGAYIVNVTPTLGAASGVTSGTSSVTFGTASLGGNTTFNITNPGTGTTDITFTGALSGATAITKLGTGRLSLTGANQLSDTSTLNVNAGTVLLGGSTTDTIATLSMGGGSLTGSGSAALTIATSYSNSFGANGNAFVPKANITAVAINNAGTSDQDVSATGLTGSLGTRAWALGNIRPGAANAKALTVTYGGGTSPGTNVGFKSSTLTNSTKLFNSGVDETSTGGAVVSLANGGSLTRSVGRLTGGTISGSILVANSFDDVTDHTITVSGTAFDYATTNFTAAAASQNFGIVRVGSTQALSLPISNTTATFADNLTTTFTGPTGITPNTTGVNLAAGTSSNVIVGLNTSSAGVRDGSIVVNTFSNGAANGLDTVGLISKTVTVTGTAYNYATTAFNNTAASQNFGNVRVGSTQNLSLAITNTASGFADNLTTTFTGFSGVSPGTAGVNLAPGASGNILVGLSTALAGVRNGSVTVNAISNGAANGLDNSTLVSKAVTVQGTAYNYATTGFTNAPSSQNFGNVRIGSLQNISLAISNTASGFADNLATTFTAPSGIAPNTTGVNLAPGASGNVIVGLNTSATGVRNGSVVVNALSNGQALGLDDSNLVSKTVSVNGTVYDYTTTNFTSSAVSQNFNNIRVGSTNQISLAITNTGIGVYTDNLTTSFTGPSGVSPNTTGVVLAPGASGNVIVELDASAQGNRNGSITVNAISNGSAFGLDQSTVVSKAVSVQGNAYDYATTNFNFTNGPTINFGTVHVGDVTTQAFAVNNTGPSGAYTDAITGSASLVSGDITANAGALNVAASGSQNLLIGLNTTSASASAAGSATVAMSSDGSAAGLDSPALGSRSFAVQGVVNNYALAGVGVDNALDGSLSGGGTVYNLDLGSRYVDSGTFSSILEIANLASGPAADVLKGGFNLAGVDDFQLTNFASFSGINFGTAQGGFAVAFNTTGLSAGSYTDTILFTPRGYNASGYDVLLSGGNITINLSVGLVLLAPEPTASLALILTAGGILTRRRRGN